MKGARVCVVCGERTYSSTADFFALPLFHCGEPMAYQTSYDPPLEEITVEDEVDALSTLEAVVICGGLDSSIRDGVIAVIEWLKKKIEEKEHDADQRSTPREVQPGE